MSHDREALIDIVEAIKLILRYVEAVDFDNLAANIENKMQFCAASPSSAKPPNDSQKTLENNIPPFPGKKLLECVM